MKVKEFIGAALIVGGLVGMIICVIASGIFYFQNPDMTDLRRFIEYPQPAIGGLACWVAGIIDVRLVKGR